MFHRFSSLITFAGLLVLTTGLGSASKLAAQSRGCPSEVRTLPRESPAAQLMAWLAEGFQGTILVPSDMTVEMGLACDVRIDRCVTLKGTRGGLDPGGLITATNLTADGPVFRIFGQGVRIQGLRFRGPVTSDHRDLVDMNIQAFAVMSDATASIDNNVFEFWNVAVMVERPLTSQPCYDIAPPVSITRNFFNRNANDDNGYGVGVREGCARIEGNLFIKNRHAVSSALSS